MRRTDVVIFTALLALAGCDKAKDKAHETVDKATSQLSKEFKGATSQLSDEYEESKVLAHAKEFIAAVESYDVSRLKLLCASQNNADYDAIMNCYYNAFVIENDQGADAARKYMADEVAKEGRSPARQKANGTLNEYFKAKGSLRTREVAGLILILAFEAKYSHRGGMVGQLIADRLGLTSPTSQPAAL